MTTVINYPSSCVTPLTKSYQSYQLNNSQSSSVSHSTQKDQINYNNKQKNNYFVLLNNNNEIEAEICQRFVQLSCEKMLASKNSRSGARLHRSLLILRLLRKAKNCTNILSYECATLLKAHQQSNNSLTDKLEHTKIQHKSILNCNASSSKLDNAKIISSKTITQSLCKQKLSNESTYKNCITKSICDKKNKITSFTNETNKCDKKWINIDYSKKDINSNLSAKKNLLSPSIISLQQQQSLTTTSTSNFLTIKQQQNKNEQLNAIDSTTTLKNEKNNNNSIQLHRNYDLYNNCKNEPSTLSALLSLSSTEQKIEKESNNLLTNKISSSNKNRHFNGRLYERIGNLSKLDVVNSDKCNEKEIDLISSNFANNNNKMIYKNEWSELDSNFDNNLINQNSNTTTHFSLFIQQQQQLQLQQKQNNQILSSSSVVMPLSSTTKFSFCGNDETFNLQMIMTNPISPPFNAIPNDSFLNISNYFNINDLSNSFKNNNNINNNCENENEFCQCKAHNFLMLNDDELLINIFEFDSNIHSDNCRKRKTSSRTDILEKRYCCEDDDNNLLLTDCLEKQSSVWPNDCDIDDTKNKIEYENNKKTNLNEYTNEKINEKETKVLSKIQNKNVEELFAQQYQHNYHHLVNNFGYYQQSVKHGSVSGGCEQIVPMARQSHFVGPIVGLVAETPRILMF